MSAAGLSRLPRPLLARLRFKLLSRRTKPTQPSAFPQAPLPETCCGSGCHNCVWIQYADAVSKYLDENREIKRTKKRWNKIKDIMDRNIPDVNLRAYLEMEMKAKYKD
jgi:hypothetical protein